MNTQYYTHQVKTVYFKVLSHFRLISPPSDRARVYGEIAKRADVQNQKDRISGLFGHKVHL